MKWLGASGWVAPLGVALTIGALCPAAAADKIAIAVGGIEKQIHLPIVLAQQLGFFKEQGLAVELFNTGSSGVNAENELIAGAVQAVSSSYDHTIDLQSKGKTVTTIVQILQVPAEVELVSSSLAGQIRSPADFKGRTLGVTGLGGMTDFLTQTLAKRGGLSPGEFSLLPVGAGDVFITAMKQGRIQAGMTTEPTISYMLADHSAEILVDLRTPEKVIAALGAPYPGNSLYVSADWLSGHKVEAQKIANALVKSLRWIANHSGEEITDKLPPGLPGPNKALYARTLAESKGMFTRDGRMPEGGPESVLRILSDANASLRGKPIDLSKTYTPEFVDAAATALEPP